MAKERKMFILILTTILILSTAGCNNKYEPISELRVIDTESNEIWEVAIIYLDVSSCNTKKDCLNSLLNGKVLTDKQRTDWENNLNCINGECHIKTEFIDENFALFEPDKCRLNPGIVCINYKVQPEKISITLQNLFESNLDNIKITMENCGSSNNPSELKNSEMKEWVISCDSPLTNIGYKGQIMLSYSFSETGQSDQMTGTLIGKIE